jgi:hypothetical protein
MSYTKEKSFMTTLPKLSIVFALLALANTHVYAAAEADTAEASNVDASEAIKSSATPDDTAPTDTDAATAEAAPTDTDATTAEADPDATTETAPPDADTSGTTSDAEDPDTATDKKEIETPQKHTKQKVKKKKGTRHHQRKQCNVNKASEAARSAVTSQTSLHQDTHCSPCQTTADAPIVQTIAVNEGPCDEACNNIA